MRLEWPKRCTYEMVVRIIADVIMVNAALLIALTAPYLWLIIVGGGMIPASPTLPEYYRAYLNTFWWLTPVCTVVFYVSGFYSRGRHYRGRYKLLIIVQAVTLSYLVFGVSLFLLRDVIQFPRAALVLAWLLTLAFSLSTRLWAVVWSRLMRAERSFVPAETPEDAVQRVLVIGGAGYIGSVLVERLLELGYKTRVLDVLLYGDTPIRGFRDHPNFELVRGDFRHIGTVVRAVKGADAIVHLGAIVGDSACVTDPELTIETNLQATRTLAEVGKRFGVKRFVFASTCSVYGARDEILDEHSSLQPTSLYARTKVESEKVLLGMSSADFSPTILRFGTIYGFSHRPRFDLVVNLLAAKAVQEGQVGIFGGRQWRPLVHVRDVAETIVLTLEAPPVSVRGQAFNVGSNEQNYQIADLGRIIQEMMPAARVVKQAKEDNRNYCVCFDKIRNTLHFQPQYTVPDGVREIVEAFESGAVSDYREPSYSNAAFLIENRTLLHTLAAGTDSWDGIKLSAEDAAMVTRIVMAVFESRSQELLIRMNEGLVQAILGDVDGFLDTLTGIELIPGPNAAIPEGHD